MRFTKCALLLLLLFNAEIAHAVVACSEPVAEVSSTANQDNYAFGAFTPTANAILVVISALDSQALTTATMSGGSLSWTQIGNQVYNTSDMLYAHWAKTGSSPGSTTITITTTGDNSGGAIMAVVQCTGIDLVTGSPIKQFKFEARTGSNPNVTMDAAFTTNSGGFAGFGMPRSPPSSTGPTSWTEICDAGQSTPTQGGVMSYRSNGETGTTLTFTSASAAYGIVGIEIYADGEGPTGPPIGSLRMLGVGR